MKAYDTRAVESEPIREFDIPRPLMGPIADPVGDSSITPPTGDAASVSAMLDLLAGTQNDILIRGATLWEPLATGAMGRTLLAVADAAAGRTALDVLSVAEVAAGYQPLDADLSSIAALTTTAFGRGLLTEASAATLKGTLTLNLVENTALSTWAGSASITTLGTIATGVWSGTAITAAKGGTGQTSYTTGDLLYASGATALSKLAAVATGSVLVSAGTGTAPAWSVSPTLTSLQATNIGNVTPGAAAFTTISTTGAAALGGTATVTTGAGGSGFSIVRTGGSASTFTMLNSGGEIIHEYNAVGYGFNVSTVRMLTINATDITLFGALKLNNAYVAGAVVPTGTLVIKDSGGTAYRIPCLV